MVEDRKSRKYIGKSSSRAHHLPAPIHIHVRLYLGMYIYIHICGVAEASRRQWRSKAESPLPCLAEECTCGTLDAGQFDRRGRSECKPPSLLLPGISHQHPYLALFGTNGEPVLHGSTAPTFVTEPAKMRDERCGCGPQVSTHPLTVRADLMRLEHVTAGPPPRDQFQASQDAHSDLPTDGQTIAPTVRYVMYRLRPALRERNTGVAMRGISREQLDTRAPAPLSTIAVRSYARRRTGTPAICPSAVADVLFPCRMK